MGGHGRDVEGGELALLMLKLKLMLRVDSTVCRMCFVARGLCLLSIPGRVPHTYTPSAKCLGS